MSDSISMFKNSQQEREFLASYHEVLDLWGSPLESVYVPTKLGKTHVIVSGKEDGIPLLLMPGAGDSAAMWYSNARDLGADYRLYAVDIVGDWGKSEIKSLPENRQDLADWMMEVITGLDLNKPHVAGLSYGGFLCANLASHYPDSINKMILMAPAATFQKLSAMFFVQALSAIFLPFRFRMEGFSRWMLAEGNKHERAFHDFSILCMSFGSPKLKVSPTVFSDTELMNIKNSTLLLVGDEEVIYDGQRVLDRANLMMPRIQAELVRGCGHHVPTENPEYVNRRMLEFLDAA